MFRLGVVGFLLTIPVAATTVTAYHDFSGWSYAATRIDGAQPVQSTQFSDSGQPVSRDVSLHEWYGAILPPDWFFNDGMASIYTNPHHTPYLQFSTPVYAFGAQFTYLMEGAGLGMNLNSPLGLNWHGGIFALDLSLDPPGAEECTPIGGPAYCLVNEFFGFTSTTPISTVYFEPTRGWGQGFNISDLSFAKDGPISTPEPSTWGIMCVVLILFCGTFFKSIR